MLRIRRCALVAVMRILYRDAFGQLYLHATTFCDEFVIVLDRLYMSCTSLRAGKWQSEVLRGPRRSI